MAQTLIVEGNDAIALANILKKRELKPPKGYQNPLKFKNEFVQIAEGIEKTSLVLEELLGQPDYTNIGIVIDANNTGAESRFSSLKKLIETKLEIENLTDPLSDTKGFVFQVLENLKIGIWIMPDNHSNGYLEHFIAELIPFEDPTWLFAQEKISELQTKDFCNFTEVKKQKALVHTFLAWQKTPGLPMGTAINAKFIDATSANADQFVNWFSHTFELEE